jgi:hypothetical protein
MSYPINFPTPQNANAQMFTQAGTFADWIKPQGCSFVFFVLVGAGGNGADGTTTIGGGGGASGAIASCLVPAFLIPDQLRVYVGEGGVGNTTANRTRVEYQQKATTGYVLLFAESGANASGTSGGSNPAGMGQNYFSAIGFLNFNAGQTGANGNANITAPTTIYIGGGAGGADQTNNTGGSVTPSYDYPTLAGGTATTGGNGRDGLSRTSNLLFGQGGSGGGGSTTASGGNGGKGGLGSGGGGGGRCTSGTSQGGKGGDGMVVIVSW